MLHHRVQRRRGAATAGHCHGETRFVAKRRAAGVEGPIQRGEETAGGMGVVDRCAEDKAVGLRRPGNQLVDTVVLKDAGAALKAFAAAAAGAVPDGFAAQLEDLRADALGLQGLRDLKEGGKSGSGQIAAAVDEQNFHRVHTSVKLDFSRPRLRRCPPMETV